MSSNDKTPARANDFAVDPTLDDRPDPHLLGDAKNKTEPPSEALLATLSRAANGKPHNEDRASALSYHWIDENGDIIIASLAYVLDGVSGDQTGTGLAAMRLADEMLLRKFPLFVKEVASGDDPNRVMTRCLQQINAEGFDHLTRVEGLIDAATTVSLAYRVRGPNGMATGIANLGDSPILMFKEGNLREIGERQGDESGLHQALFCRPVARPFVNLLEEPEKIVILSDGAYHAFERRIPVLQGLLTDFEVAPQTAAEMIISEAVSGPYATGDDASVAIIHFQTKEIS